MLFCQKNPQFFYWCFNVRLIHDVHFYEHFKLFWNCWVEQKNDYDNLLQWWEIGKTQIKNFCQQFLAYSSCNIKHEMTKLEKDISIILQALVRSHYVSLQDMDAPTQFFFNLNKKCFYTNHMHALRTPDGNVTSDPVEMRRLAVDFYANLYAKECTGNLVADEFLITCLCWMKETQRTWTLI